MTTPELVMWLLVGCVGLLSRRNLTAFALAAAWLLSQAYYLRTGGEIGLAADIIVISWIFAKATIREGCSTYPTMRDQMRCCWSAVTPCDKAIVGLYVLGAWPVYALVVDQYWPLYYITAAQLLLAGAEALLGYYRSRRVTPPETDSSNILQFAPAYGRRAHKFYGAEHRPSSATLLAKRAGGDG